MTMTLVSTVTVGAGGAASIEFTGIAGTATDLVLVISGRSDYAGTYRPLGIQFNGDAASNYSYRSLIGTGSAASSQNSASNTGIYPSAPIMAANAVANTFGNAAIYIPNYGGSTTKAVSVDGVGEDNATAAYQVLTAGLWNSTATITSISVFPLTSNFVQYSTASLYTITKGSGGASVA